MDETLPNTTITTDATLFREEAERARRYAAAMTDKKVIDRLNQIAALYDELAAARELFYRDGIHAVSVDSIAEAAGSNKTTLYRHFEIQGRAGRRVLTRADPRLRPGL